MAVYGRRFDVERLFLDDTDIKLSVGNDPAATINAAVAWILRNYKAGYMLVFGADVAETNACVGALKKLSFGIVCPLHVNSDIKEKHRALTSDIGHWTQSHRCYERYRNKPYHSWCEVCYQQTMVWSRICLL